MCEWWRLLITFLGVIFMTEINEREYISACVFSNGSASMTTLCVLPVKLYHLALQDDHHGTQALVKEKKTSLALRSEFVGTNIFP